MKSLNILGENYVNVNCAITASSGADTDYLFDQDPATQWMSSGSTEGTTETLIIEFKDRQGVAVSRTIDRLILLNINLSKFYIQYWNGSAWVTFSTSVHGTGTENADASVYIEVAAPVATTKIQLVMTNTISAVAEKKVGEIKACLITSQIRHRVLFERSGWDNSGVYRLQDGGLVVYQTARKMRASVKIYDMSLTTYELIRDALFDKEWMTWILWDDFRTADIYEVVVANHPTEILDRKTQLYSVDFSVEER